MVVAVIMVVVFVVDPLVTPLVLVPGWAGETPLDRAKEQKYREMIRIPEAASWLQNCGTSKSLIWSPTEAA